MAGALWDRYISAGLRRLVCQALGVSDDHARRLIELWAGWHDIGKIMPEFQKADRGAFAKLTGYESAVVSEVRRGHDFAVHVWLAEALAARGYAPRGLSRKAPAVRVAQMLGGHHGRFYPLKKHEITCPLRAVPDLGDGAWERQRVATLDCVSRVIGDPAPPATFPAPVAAVITGLIMLADWLASQDDFLLRRLPDVPSEPTLAALTAHHARSRELAPGLLEKAGLVPVRLRPGTFAEEFPDFPANGLQQVIAERLPPLLTGPGMLVVMAPTGEGKTEAAWHAARLMGEAAGCRGSVLALPTMATANQLYGRKRRYLHRRAEKAAALTLQHSLAWMNPVYSGERDGEPDAGADSEYVGGDDHQQAKVTVADWLRARKRGLLAHMSVITIDQALVAMLPVRHNVLRLFGLAGKVLVIDEAHAYDAYMQGLLRLLLRWLAHLKVPVVLLSATLPAETARRLIEAYRDGAGHPGRVDVPVAYPGCLYVDGDSGKISELPVTMKPQPPLTITRHPVAITKEGQADRVAVLRALLAPVATTGGCALVVCTTVADAQETYRQLKTCSRKEGFALDLLHARFPVRQRQQITEEIEAAYGKPGSGQRPEAAILIATQVVEQSLDLDFDLVISDLAPMALLLQRAGRCWRHARQPEDRRGFTRRQLAVLTPASRNGELFLPWAWKKIYDEALLIRTQRLLEKTAGASIGIPDDVQRLVDGVYDAEFAEGITEIDTAWAASEEVQAQLAGLVAVPAPKDLRSLYQLSEHDVDEDLIATRLGADSVRVIACYTHPDGRTTLDTQGNRPLPEKPLGRRFTRAEVRELYAETIPVRSGPWSRHRGSEGDPPPPWRDNPWLRDLILLPHPVDENGAVSPATVGGRTFRLDRVLGLVT